MKVLFAATHFGFLRNFESTLRLLAERGHSIHLVADRRDNTGGQTMVERVCAEHPSISYEIVPFSKHSLWYAFATGVRSCLDYWRYLDPRFEQSPKLRARAKRQAWPPAHIVGRLSFLRRPAMLRFLAAMFRAFESVVPPRAAVVELFRRQQPDLLLVTPLLYFGTQQVDHVRCARGQRVKSVLCVGSWDHLTTKGLIHEVPDRVIVWNEAQKKEAAELHAIPADRVIVTGAQAYDHWFSARPSSSRHEFCARVGVSPERPFLLYLCSSPFIAEYEVGFVKEWIRSLRAATSERVRTAGLLVRPHPQNAEQWQGEDLSEFVNVALWPRGGANPVDLEARAEFFDSMCHSDAVVGINTSALIESGIVGRPAYTVLVKEFSGTQEGTLHFQHLKQVSGGLLNVATSLEEHREQLSALLAGDGAERRNARGFLEAFVRPHGLDTPATPKLVAAVETFAATGDVVSPPHWLRTRLLRVVAYPAVLAAAAVSVERDRVWSFVLHATRPARLVVKAAAGRVLFGVGLIARVSRTGVRLMLHAARTVASRTVVRPARWIFRRARLAVQLLWAAGRNVSEQ